MRLMKQPVVRTVRQYTGHDVNAFLRQNWKVFELRCNKCRLSNIMTVVLSPTIEMKKQME